MHMAELICSKHSICLRWDVSHVSALTMMAAAHYIAIRRPETQVRLEFFWGAWNSEFFLQTSSALARIAELAAFRGVVPLKQTKRLVRSFSTVMQDEGELIASAFRAWDRKQEKTPVSDLSMFGPLAKYTVVYNYNERHDELVFAHIGAYSGAMKVHGPAWSAIACGRLCNRSQPDLAYETRASAMHRGVLESGEPISIISVPSFSLKAEIRYGFLIAGW